MRTRRITAALVASVLLFGTAAGCASGSDDEGSSDDTEQESNDTDTTAGDSGDSGDSGDTEDTGDLGDLGDLGDDLGDLGDLGGDCLEFSLAYSGLYLSVLGAVDEESAQEIQDSIDELNASVPDDIADDFETVSAAISDWVDAISEYGLLSEEATQASEALDEGDVAEANQNIEDWLAEECS